MKQFRITIVLIASMVPVILAAQGGKNYGQFAPDDAYLDGSLYAYYGSENEWSRRMFSARAADRFYKRRGQRQLLAILDGHPEKAVELCQKRLDDDPGDLESLFILTVAWCQLNNLGEAMHTMERAVDTGLPFGRFLAGPREFLRPLTDSKAFQPTAARYPLQLLHGPMLGAVTDSSARFWVRTVDELPVTVRVHTSKGSEAQARQATFLTKADHDYTAIVEITGLEPDSRYFYDVLVNGEPTFGSDCPSFRTYPAKNTPSRIQIGFGGGAGYTPQHEHIWDMIASHHLAAFLFLGDNVYIDLPEHQGAFHNYTYYRRQSRPEFRRLVRSTPIFAIWDDHDSAIDDVWLGPYLDKPDWKLSMLRLFRNNWNNPAYGDEKWPGCWFRFSIADVDFFMLDGRFYRSNPFAENRTMLGPVQKRWLFDELKKSKAVFKVIASPVAWAQGAKPGSKDTWDGFPEEREEIFSFIEKHRINGVLFLSADRHRSDAWKIERPGAYAFYDLMSSRLTNIHKHEVVPGAMFSYNKKCSFGLLTFDTTVPDPEVTYQIINIDGEVLYSLVLKKSQLVH